jgi:hypothetical protein
MIRGGALSAPPLLLTLRIDRFRGGIAVVLQVRLDVRHCRQAHGFNGNPMGVDGHNQSTDQATGGPVGALIQPVELHGLPVHRDRSAGPLGVPLSSFSNTEADPILPEVRRDVRRWVFHPMPEDRCDLLKIVMERIHPGGLDPHPRAVDRVTMDELDAGEDPSPPPDPAQHPQTLPGGVQPVDGEWTGSNQLCLSPRSALQRSTGTDHIHELASEAVAPGRPREGR